MNPGRFSDIFTRKRIWTTIAVLVGTYIIGSWLLSFITDGLPSLEELENPRPPLATTVYSVDGVIIDKFYEENRSRTPSLDSIPRPLIQALLATEDTRFYEHWGVDLRSVFRVVLVNLSHFTLSGPGGSTITQQLARNLYLTREVSIIRKLREWITAVQIEKRYTKDEILLMYLNVAAFGRGSYGVQTAAMTYFNKTPGQLTVPECAFLVGLLKAPTIYDPRRNYDRAVLRRNVVMKRMVDEGYLSEEEYDRYKAEPITTETPQRNAGIAPHFVEYIRQQLRERAEKYGFNLYRDGISVYTTLDSRMQRYANRAVMEHLKTFQKTFSDRWDWNDPRNTALFANAINNAIKSSKEYRKAGNDDARELVLIRMRRNQQFIDSVKMALTRIQVGFAALDPKSGQIRAMVGNSDVNFRYGLNHATQILRQPGSTFKPFVYTVAIDNGYTPAYQISNEPLSVDDGTGKKWTPHNSGGETGGIYTLRRGLANSVNLVAIRTMLEIAPADEVIRYAHRMGITSVLRPVASLAIGTSEVVPLEITAAYGSFANEGIYAKPISILKVVDRDGRVLESNSTELREVLSKETAYIITSMLKSVITSGTGGITRSFFTAPAAGKTGTTQDYADAWFIGYTPDLVAGVWTGFDDRRITYTGSYGQGAQAAGPIWGRFMKYVYEDPSLKMVARDFAMPENVVQVKICIDSQCLAGPNCPNTVVEYVNKRYMPGVCVKHGGGGTSPSKTDRNTIEY